MERELSEESQSPVLASCIPVGFPKGAESGGVDPHVLLFNLRLRESLLIR